MKWCLDADPTAASHITTLAATGVKSPSSASLSVKSLKDGPVISDHHYAESSPNLMRAPSSKVPSAAPSIINADVPEAEHKRLAYLVIVYSFRFLKIVYSGCVYRLSRSPIILRFLVGSSNAPTLVLKAAVWTKFQPGFPEQVSKLAPEL